ncbi:hypothetical protein J4468_00125 [Candidatus Woesearchaeota archaeon]|nr:hypothetical protein [Candidatus Woesearchaeota archaeon]
MKMKILLLVAVFFLCIFTVNALTDVSINATSATNSIYPGKDAVFSVEITNTGTREDIFVLKLNEFIEDSDFAYEARITPSAMSIKNGQTGKFEIVVKTKIDARPNKNYKMKFAVRSSLDFDFNKAFELITRIYEPSKIIKIEPQLLETIEAKSEVPFRFMLENTVDMPLNGVDIYVTSDLELINDKRNINLAANERKVEEFMFNFPKTTLSKEYTVNVRIYDKARLIGEYSGKFLISSNPNIKESLEEKNSFFIKKIKLERENTGNEIMQDEAKVNLGYFQKMFAYGIPREDGTEKIEGKYYMVWKETLEPGNKLIFFAIVDYRPAIVALLVVVMFSFLSWFLLMRGLRIKKKIVKSVMTSQGSNIKVMISLKNTTNTDFRNVEVTEIIPNYLHDTEEYTTLKPKRIQKGKSSKKIVWEIDELKRGDEIIVTYSIKSKVQFIGSVLLPATMVQYMNNKGDMKKVVSNNLEFNSEMLKKR